VQRKIQRRPIRSIREKVIEEPRPTKGINIQGAVTVLGGLTGVIVAILWIAGRFYAAAFFGAMNIPVFQVNFSIWEYAEVSWLRLIVYFLKTLSPIAVFLTIAPLVILAFVLILQAIFPRLKLRDAASNIASGMDRLQPTINYMVAFVAIVVSLTILLQAFSDVYRFGETNGKNAVLSSSYAVQVYSKDYLPLGPSKVTSDITSTLVEYDGLRLLTFNNGKYYLFRDIDPITCKPSQVFIITDSPAIAIVLSAAKPIDTPCITTDVQ